MDLTQGQGLFRSLSFFKLSSLRYCHHKSDALYLYLDESKIIESEEVQPGIVLDYNAAKRAE
jgi:hypothetical protein